MPCKILNGLNPSTYEHDFDRKALEGLQRVPKLDQVLQFITRHAVENVYSIRYTGSHLRVSKQRYPEIYKYLEQACTILDIRDIPELYVRWNYAIDADTVGSEHPIMILNSGMLDLCTDDEIMYLIGHELGHIKSNHMLYHMTAEMLGFILDFVPFVGKASQAAIYYWDRMSDLTADRAGLLCCQNPDAAISALMKMAGSPIKQYNRINSKSFIEQARSFEGLKDVEPELDLDLDNEDNSTQETNLFGRLKAKLHETPDERRERETKLIKMISIASSKEPWTVMRASELMKWIDSGKYNEYVR